MKNILFLPLVFWVLSCKPHHEKPSHGCGNDCPKDIICTMELVSLNVEVKNPAGEPVALDYIISTQVKNNATHKITPEAHFESEGSYTVWGDRMLSETNKKPEIIRIEGYKNNTLVFTRMAKVASNCCHVEWIEGERNIVVASE